MYESLSFGQSLQLSTGGLLYLFRVLPALYLTYREPSLLLPARRKIAFRYSLRPI